MLENHKLFIQRHIQKLIYRDLSSEKILEKSFSILDSQTETNKAIELFHRSGSLIKTLHETGVIQLEQPLLKAISTQVLEQENAGNEEHFAFATMLEANQTVGEILSLMKTRLTSGLTYALWLSTIATVTVTATGYTTLPHFEKMYSDFGTELPFTTQIALSWQNSIFSPMIFGIILCIAILFLIITVQRLTKNNSEKKYARKIPFIGSVIRFAESIQWLSHLRVLVSTGLDINNCLTIIKKQPQELNKHLPDMMNELKTAEKIKNLDTEFDFQIHQINQQAEKVVTNASRKFLNIIMAIVVSFVIFIIIVTYLPIFSLGAII